MTNKDILKAMGDIDPKLILDAEPKNKKIPMKMEFVKRQWVRYGMAATCLVVLSVLLFGVGNVVLKQGAESKLPNNEIVGNISNNPDSPEISILPVDKQAYYTAEDVQKFFETRKNDAVATSYYTKVYVPSAEYLKISPILTKDTIAVYEKKKLEKPLDEKEFTEFLDLIAPKLLNAIGEDVRPYEIKKNSLTLMGDYLEVSLNGNSQLSKHFVYAEQTEEYYAVTLSSDAEVLNPIGSISLGGVNVEADQTKTDLEILQSLEVVKEKLYAIFGVEFVDAKIVRKYDSYSEHGVSFLYVYFYNEDAHPLNAMCETPVSDYISIRFDNFANTAEDVLSESVLQTVSISYRQNRENVEASYVESKKLQMISLEEAEEMLAKGYVFGGHACSYCMEAQEAVEFSGYDKVGMTYIMGRDEKGNEIESIPFYVFYKYIHDAENGNQTYAKTYVPAVAVNGCEEYFESQKQYHTLAGFLEDKSE